jgi:tetratricopeptide (TPR) repeat protein
MQNFYNSNPGEEARGRKLALDFEKRLQQGCHTYIDLLSVEEIFHYYHTKNNLLKAVQLVQYARTWHPDAADLFLKEAWLRLELRDHEEALAAVEQALLLDPSEPNIVFLKTEILAKLDRYEEAIDLLRGMLSITLSPKEVLLQMGNVAQLCGHERQSEQYYREALNHAPDFEEAVYELAFLLESLDKNKEAIAVYVDFLEKRPYAAKVWYELGRLYDMEGDSLGALDAFDYAIIVEETEYRQTHFQAIYEKGKTLLSLNRAEEAIGCFLKAVDCQKDDIHAKFFLGISYKEAGMFKLAIRYFQLVVKQDPYYIEGWTELGLCLESWEKYLEAVFYYYKAFRLETDSEKLAFYIARCEFKLGNLFSAQEHVYQAIELCPDAFYVWEGWAALLAGEGHPMQALRFVKEGLNMNPRQASLYYLASAYAYLNKEHTQAFNYLKNAMLMGPLQEELLFRLAPNMKEDILIQSLIERYNP